MVRKHLQNILITGGNGRLARAFSTGIRLQKKDLDITNPTLVHEVIQKIKPDYIIHPAAITDVDYCEAHPTKALATNTIGTFNVINAANSIGAKILLVSTGAVFDYKTPSPISRTANPKNIYGKTKAVAEEMVRTSAHKWSIIRTGWLFGPGETPKFVETMVRKIASGEKHIKVLDQTGCPTYSLDLAKAILKTLKKNQNSHYHLINKGQASRIDVARHIQKLLGKECHITLAKPAEFNLIAKRPTYEILKPTPPFMRPWKKALSEYIQTL